MAPRLREVLIVAALHIGAGGAVGSEVGVEGGAELPEEASLLRVFGAADWRHGLRAPWQWEGDNELSGAVLSRQFDYLEEEEHTMR